MYRVTYAARNTKPIVDIPSLRHGRHTKKMYDVRSRNPLSGFDFLKSIYREFFGMKPNEMINDWTPKEICLKCCLQLKKNKKRAFASPVIWRKPKHHDHFCLTSTFGNTQTQNGPSFMLLSNLWRFLSFLLLNRIVKVIFLLTKF